MSIHLGYKNNVEMIAMQKTINKCFFWTIPFLITLALLLVSNTSFSQKSGEELYTMNCAACHRTDEGKLVGPGLKGINEKRSQEWLLKWIKNSQELIASGDQDAVAVFEEFNKLQMINYTMFSDAEIVSILEYVDEINLSSGVDVASNDPSSSPTATTTANPQASKEMLLLNSIVIGFDRVQIKQECLILLMLEEFST